MKPDPPHKCIDRGSFSDPSVRGEIWSSSSIFILNFGVFWGCGRSAVGVSALRVSDVVEAQFIAQIILECVIPSASGQNGDIPGKVPRKSYLGRVAACLS